MLDLESISSVAITYNNQDDGYSYIWTPCRNGDQCKNAVNGTNTGMFMQRNEKSCQIVSNWDHGDLQPTFKNNQWLFYYQNGDECSKLPTENTTLTLVLECDEDGADHTVVSAGEEPYCYYEMYVISKLACPTYQPSSDSKSKISAGSIFIIIFFVGLLLYFVVGWIIMAISNRKDHGFTEFTANIPHITFWTMLPSLIVAGCVTSYESLFGLCCNDDIETAENYIGNLDDDGN